MGIDRCRLLIDAAPRSGAENMAGDEVLLESAVRDRLCTVRIYRWKEPTVSLGYFQRPDDLTAAPLKRLPTVRRLTGGGAILHHHEWTYSCAVPAGHPAIRIPGRLYAAVHRRIVALLRAYGVTASLRKEAAETAPRATSAAFSAAPSVGPSSKAAFLCFLRGDENDILLRGHKIVGSAQRRRKGAVLQHGSLLWKASAYAPHLPGVLDLSPDVLSPDVFPADALPAAGAEQLGRCLAGLFSSHIEPGEFSLAEQQRAAALQPRYEQKGKRERPARFR